jgi:hypothetical protein
MPRHRVHKLGEHASIPGGVLSTLQDGILASVSGGDMEPRVDDSRIGITEYWFHTHLRRFLVSICSVWKGIESASTMHTTHVHDPSTD